MFTSRSRVQSYGLAISVTILALLLMLGLDPWFKTSHTAFLLFFGAVTISALYGGTKPGVVATLLSALLANYFFFELKRGFTLDLANNARMLLFIIQGFAISYLCGALRYAQKRTQASLQQLQADRAERERLLQELENERIRFEAVLRQMPAGVMIADAASGQLILANEQVGTITGHDYEMRSRLEEYDRVVPFDGFAADGRRYEPDEWPLARSLLTGEVIVNEEIELQRDDGSRIFIDVNSAPIRDSQGEIVAAVVIFQDISERQAALRERKRVELSLRKSETLLDAIFAGSPVGLAFLDRDLRYIHANEALAAINGLPLAAHLGRTLGEVLPEWTSIGTEILQRVMETREPLLNWEISGQATPMASYRHCLVNFYPVGLPDGELLGVGVTAVDITELKQTEQALRESEALALARAKELEIFMETVPVGVWIARDPQCHQMVANPTAYKLMKREQGSIATATPADGVNPFAFKQVKDGEEIPLSELPMQRAARTGQEVEAELELLFDNGEVRYLYGRAVPLRDESGNLQGAIGAFLDLTERKQIQEALRRREEELRLVTNQVPALISFVDTQQCYRFNNRIYEEWFGHSAAEVHGKHIREVLGEPAYEKIRPYVEQVLAGQQVTHESQIPYQDGGTRYIEATYVPQLDERGNVEGFVALVGDISERKRAEEALRKSKERFRISQELSLDAFTILRSLWDESGAIVDFEWTYANPKAAEILKHPAEELVGQRLLQLLPGNKINSELFDRYVRVVETGEPHDIELFYNSEGIEGWFRNMCVKLDDGVAVFFSDITERKRAEEELRQSEERYRYLAEAIPQLVWTADGKGRNDYVNQQMCDYLGLAHEELLDLNWRTALHPDDREPTYRHWMESVQSGLPYEMENRLRRSDGVYRWHLVRAIPLKDESDRVVKWFGASTDIHEQKELEKQRLNLLQQEQAARTEAEKANRIKDEFLAVLSHELRTPLNPIVGWSHLLRTRQWDEQTLARGLETIERNAKLQTQLIEDLLDVSRILRGKLSLNMTPVNLAAVIEGALDTVRLAAQAKSIEIQTHFDASTSIVLGDLTRLQQVVWNLLSNAVKFTPSGGRVAVRLEKAFMKAEGKRHEALGSRHEESQKAEEKRQKEEISPKSTSSALSALSSEGQSPDFLLPISYCLITVIDTGKGISPDFLPYVFDRFRQADSATTRNFGGLGLGLAICRQLVEMHGGSIKADSPGEGQGTTFTVQLPLMASVGNSENALESKVSHNLDGIKILIVDDEVDSRELLRVMLREVGAEAIAVPSAREALKVLSQTKLDAIVSDIGMSQMDGYRLLRQIRSLPPEQGGKIPAIALTAYAGEIDRQQALLAGYQKHLAKPVMSDQLIAAIAELV